LIRPAAHRSNDKRSAVNNSEMADKSLKSVTILVTRPQHQAQPFFTMVRQAGGTAIRFPVIEIKEIELSKESRTVLRQNIGRVIFISGNAVRLGVPAISAVNPQWLGQAAVIAIGKATAARLQERGIEPGLVPPSPCNSEALLAMPEMQDITRHQYTIVKGRGGRDYLRKQLNHRGARVNEIDIYVRVRPKISNTPLSELMKAGRAVVAITSVKGLHHLFEMASNEQGKWLKRNARFLVPGARIAAAVCDLHIRQVPIIAEDATDAAMYERLLKEING